MEASDNLKYLPEKVLKQLLYMSKRVSPHTAAKFAVMALNDYQFHIMVNKSISIGLRSFGVGAVVYTGIEIGRQSGKGYNMLIETFLGNSLGSSIYDWTDGYFYKP